MSFYFGDGGMHSILYFAECRHSFHSLSCICFLQIIYFYDTLELEFYGEGIYWYLFQNILKDAAKSLSSLKSTGIVLGQKASNKSVSLQLRSQELDQEKRLAFLQRSFESLCRYFQLYEDDEKKLSLAISDIEEFLKTSEETSSSMSLNLGKSRSHDECVCRLKEILASFREKQQTFDSLNRLAHALPLDEGKSRLVENLSSQWHKLLNNTKEQMQLCQQNVLLRQDFQQKCNVWLSILTEIEKDLSMPLAGSYEGLKQQNKQSEVFLNLLLVFFY